MNTKASRRCVVTGIIAGLIALPVGPAAAAGLGGPTLRAMNPDETVAYGIWSLRAGLNVAALQCQFSPFLATVRNYNDLLKQHDTEFAKAYGKMEAHFRRYDGAASRKTFDSFTTSLYNSYSTLKGQRSFCAAAGEIGRAVLAQPRGTLPAFAQESVVKLRGSLVAPPDPYLQVRLDYVRIPRIPDPCIDKKGKPVRRC